MTTKYETNAAAYDAAIDESASWVKFQDPADVHDAIRNRLFWAMLAAVPPDEFAAMLAAAEDHAGKPAQL